MKKTGRHIDDVSGNLELGIHKAIYNSPEQKKRRFLIVLSLTLKHGFRGLFFSWPLYLLGFASFILPGQYSYLLALFLIPGIYISYKILYYGLLEDYKNFVKDFILKPEAMKYILFKIRTP